MLPDLPGLHPDFLLWWRIRSEDVGLARLNRGLKLLIFGGGCLRDPQENKFTN